MCASRSRSKRMAQPLLTNPVESQSLLGVIKHLSQEKIDCFGAVSGGVGAIHLDPAFCRNTRFGSTLAQGYMLIAYVAEMLKNNFGRAWLESGNLDVKLTGPAFPGHTVIAGGVVSSLGDNNGAREVHCEVWLDRHDGTRLIAGHARLTLPAAKQA